MENPKLRPVQAVPVRDGRQLMFRLSDPSPASDETLVVSEGYMRLAALFDGTRSVADVQVAWVQQTGQFVLQSKIDEVVRQLDEALFLDSPRLRDHLRERVEAFRQAPSRPATSAGSGYPGDPSELTACLDGHFEAEGLSSTPGDAPGEERLVGLVAPHIDFDRGGPAYAHAYAALAAGAPDAELYVVLGTAHYSDGSPFILTHQDFETPLGTMRTDAELVDALAARAGSDLFREELVHASEHSIELQVVWVQHVLGGRRAALLPILCCSPERHVGDDGAPRDVPELAAFLDALRGVLDGSGRRVCVIAGADLAHVGRHFGDEFRLTPALMADVERADRATLAHAERLQAEDFFQAVMSDGNARHVCGLPNIYALLATTDATRCELLDYRQAADYDVQCAVTFASLALYA